MATGDNERHENERERAREKLVMLNKEFAKAVLNNDVLFGMIRDEIGDDDTSSMMLPSFSMRPWQSRAKDDEQDLGVMIEASGRDEIVPGVSAGMSIYKYVPVATVVEMDGRRQLVASSRLLEVEGGDDEKLAAVGVFRAAHIAFHTSLLEGKGDELYSIDPMTGTIVVADDLSNRQFEVRSSDQEDSPHLGGD